MGRLMGLGASGKGKKGRNPRYFSQWSSTFYAAAELTRRGYLVSITLGRAPKVDLLVESPSGKPFKVQVKSLQYRNYWLIGEVPLDEDLFYILVYVPRDLSRPPEFCILTSKEMYEEVGRYQEGLKEKGKPITRLEYCIPFDVAFKYKNAWDKLPK
jgi:hypothetical protein